MSGSVRSSGSSTSTPISSCRPDSARSERCQSTGPTKSEMTTARPRRRGGRRSCSIAAAQVSPLADRRPWGGRQGAQQVLQVGAAAAGRDPGDARAGREHGTDAVAAALAQVGDRRGGGDDQIPLLATGGAEVQRGRQVGDDPGLQLTVGDGLPDVRLGGAGGHRPVHPPDVVPRVVRPGVARFRPRSRHQTEVVALQQAVQPAADGELEVGQRTVDARRVGEPWWCPRRGPPGADRRRVVVHRVGCRSAQCATA